MDLPLGRVYLDVLAPRERVNFELDGTRYHGGRREQDMRRDAALVAKGITVVRYTHRRLTTEPSEVRREIRQILASRAPGVASRAAS